MLKNRAMQNGTSRVLDDLVEKSRKKRDEEEDEEDFDEDEFEGSGEEDEEDEEELDFEDLLMDIILKYLKGPLAKKLHKDVLELMDVMEENE